MIHTLEHTQKNDERKHTNFIKFLLWGTIQRFGVSFSPLAIAAMPGTASSLKFPVVKDLLASSKEVSLFDDVF